RVALAPHGRGAHPVGPVLRAALLVEVRGVDPVGVALERERALAQVGEQRGRDPGVVVDHLALGEADLGIEDLVEVGELELVTLDLDRGRRRAHPFLLPAFASGPAVSSAPAWPALPALSALAWARLAS